ncbi:MAG: hypothetical protein B6245_05815 [Desulfobacteraceae bacterium 4572_88]|nr:MAG: hypothetical protein B6245_05815 [Desulfobacteraceae bacterium 4572_88]
MTVGCAVLRSPQIFCFRRGSMFNNKSVKLSFLLGLYLLISIIAFSVGLLMWTYHTSKQAIDQELRTAFMQRHVVAENIMERKHELIRLGLCRIAENALVASAISRYDLSGTKDILSELLSPLTDEDLDILFVSLPGHPVWANMTSPFFAADSLLPEITGYAEKLLSSGRILRLKKNETDLTMMLQSLPIIQRQSGKVLGTLFGGVVLNDNFSLLEMIRKKTMSEVVIFLEHGDIIASTYLPDARNHLIFRNTEKNPAGQVYSVDGLLTRYQRLSVMDQPSSLSIVLGVTDQILTDLKVSYQQKGIFLLFSSLCFLIFTIFMIRWLTFPSLKKLIRYSREISHGNLKARYQQGIISEFNQLGHATEKMVGTLQDTQEQFVAFMNNLPLGAFIKDEHSVVRYVNQYLKDVFDAEKWTDKDICEIMPAEVMDRLRADDLRGLEAPIILEEIMLDKNGLPRTYETRKFPIRRQGKAPLLGGIAIEISLPRGWLMRSTIR